MNSLKKKSFEKYSLNILQLLLAVKNAVANYSIQRKRFFFLYFLWCLKEH